MGLDPLELRVINAPNQSRKADSGGAGSTPKAHEALRTAAAAIGWHDPKPEGVGRGIALVDVTNSPATDYTTRLIVRPYTHNIMRMVVAKYSVEDVYTGKRKEIETEITDQMKPLYAEKGLVLEQLLIRHESGARKEVLANEKDDENPGQTANDPEIGAAAWLRPRCARSCRRAGA